MELNARHTFGVVLPVVAMATAILFGLSMSAEALEQLGPWVFLASIVLFGLPHGAVDHLVIASLSDEPLFSARVALYILGYIALVAVTLGLWLAAPLVVFAGFILLTWFHWGQGDAWFVPSRDGDWWLTVAFRGSLPMLVPLVAFPEAYASVADAFIAAAGAEVDTAPYIHMLRIPAAATVALLGVLRILRLSDARERSAELFESGLLVLAFSVVQPVFAIALYFCFWHAPRHILRLADDLYRQTWAGLAQALVAAIPLTLVSIAFLVGVFWFVESEDLFSVYLALIAALTVPHVVVVTWMDVK